MEIETAVESDSDRQSEKHPDEATEDQSGSGSEAESESSAKSDADSPTDSASSSSSPPPTARMRRKRVAAAAAAAATDEDPPTTTTPPPPDADRFEELVELEHRENLMRAWRRTHRFRTVPCPSAPPLYLSEPLELVWSETDATTRRRLFNRRKYRQPADSSFQRKNLRAGDQQTPPPPPPPLKTNRTYHLRNAFANRRPIISAYFDQHYTAHRKPPFKRFNVKFVNCPSTRFLPVKQYA